MNTGTRTTLEQSNTTNIETERARLRRNQRNSRARKQAHIQNLEKQWNDCMRLGAQATVEMQREAQRVQDENKILRSLLHDQGFDDVAIQRAIDAAKLTQRSHSLKARESSSRNFSPIPCLPALSRTERPQPPEDREERSQPPVPRNFGADHYNLEDVFNAEASINDQLYPSDIDLADILFDDVIQFPDVDYDPPAFSLQDESPASCPGKDDGATP
ncbi:hypothetical protein F5Y11DRAFT_350311 [Daldinia sp. FL1419]|nr:hypothetical protein F5Y11DRAFT_350311 [Daldinia sp. FL1419]